MIPKYQRKRDGIQRESVKEFIAYLKNNAEWMAPSAMVGKKIGSMIFVLKPKGSIKFIEFKQTPDNKFEFPILESVSLFFAKRLICIYLSNENTPFTVSGHYLVNLAISSGIPFRTISSYCLFTRLASSKRKPKFEQKKKEAEVEITANENSYINSINRIKNLGPTINESFDITNVYPATYYIKIKATNNKVNDTIVNFDYLPSHLEFDTNIVHSYTKQCIISIKPAPVINKYIIPHINDT